MTSIRFAKRGVVALAASFAMSMSWAATNTAQGDFFGATVTMDGGWSMSFTQSLQAKTASLVIDFWDVSNPAVDTWSRTMTLRNLSITGPQYIGTNAEGDSVYAQIDLSRWSFSVSGTLSAPPADAIFKTAYGNEGLIGSFLGSSFTNVSDKPTFSGLTLTPPVPADAEPLVTDEAVTLPGLIGRFGHTGTTPYYAKPSTTNPRCNALSCLDYEAGQYTPQRYVLTFALAETVVPTSTVPEPGAGWMALVGLGMAGAIARRRRA